MKKEKVIVILGPTSSGKTALSIALARKYNGEIISADSRQVYRGMDLGTGKVTKAEMAGIPHHLLDVANPQKQFSVADYTALATAAIEDIVTRKKTPIICGGTGFDIDTLIGNAVLPEVPPDASLRKKLEKKSAPELFAMLKKLDAKRAQTIDANNPVRLVRAIEIAKALGAVPPLGKKVVPYKLLIIGLDMPDELLKTRIATRLEERLEGGMLSEATRLHAKGLSWRRMREFGLEYRAMAELLTSKTTQGEFETKLATDIWHYAKRQRQWFKRDKHILWLDSSKKDTVKSAQLLVEKFLV